MDYTLSLVLQGAGMLGFVAGMLGCFALLRQQSLLGDAISHAAFPGIVLMFLITHSKNPWILLCGGALAGCIGVALMNCIIAYTRLKKDAVLGIVLSVFFGCGLILMTVAQKTSLSQQAILNKFLFGNVATILPEDICVIQIIALIIILTLCLLWKECKLYLFDPVCAKMLGFSTAILECVITVLLILTIVIGLQVVGVVLMSALLIAPAAAARQWTNQVHIMVLLAGIFGCVSGITGTLISSMVEHVPTGPAIVVVASGLVMLSLVRKNFSFLTR